MTKESEDFYRALNWLRRPEARLIKQHGGRTEHFVVPGGYVDAKTAQKLKDHPQVIGSPDGLWPGHEQTWRIKPPRNPEIE